MKRPLIIVALLVVAGCGSAGATTPTPAVTDAQGRHGVPYKDGWVCESDGTIPFDSNGRPPTLCYGTLYYPGHINITDPNGNVVATTP